MSTSKPNTTIPRHESLGVRTHRFTALPVKDVLKIRMKDLGIRNVDLQKALGYDMPNVIAMLKTGSMRLPEAKAIKVADALQLDRTFFLGKVIAENHPELWEALTTVMGDRLVSANELALIHLTRQGLDGHDVQLAESAEFTTVFTSALKDILRRENALAQAVIDRKDD